jgi:3-hydroxy acid dehydrogenase / malonic semialdehyde reductase
MRTALVTGASSGVGRAIAESLAASGRRVLAVGRDPARLAEVAATPGIVPLNVDIRDREGLTRHLGGETIDILVNNAGLMPPLLPFDEADVADIDAAIAVNITASLVLTNLVVKGMRARQRGHVFFTGSVAGHTPFPRLAVYGATKAALGAFADGLRLDMAAHGVKVTEIVAGRIETNLYSTLLSAELRAAMYAGGTAVQPQDVADMVLAILKLPPAANVSRFDIVPVRQATTTGAVKKEG